MIIFVAILIAYGRISRIKYLSKFSKRKQKSSIRLSWP